MRDWENSLVTPILVKLCTAGEVRCKCTAISTVEVNTENERFTVRYSICHQNNKCDNFTLFVEDGTNCSKVRAARVACLYLFVQPIKFLVFGVGVAVDVVAN